MKKLVIGNWKMNPPTFAQADKLVRAAAGSKNLGKVKVVLCPPFVWLTDLSHKPAAGLEFGAQDVFWEAQGAFTGEISPKMLKNSGVKYVIIGHSERRQLGETDGMVNRKVKAALAAGLKVILCVGESAEIRSKGMGAAKRAIAAQLKAGLAGVRAEGGKLAVAYEPVWAIGTGNPDDPAAAEEMAGFIRSILNSKFQIPNSKFPVLYGGSVTSGNTERFLSCKDIDGALVGGASLSAPEFKKIVALAAKNK